MANNNWRPSNWREHLKKAIKEKPSLLEAGADAMLEALKKDGQFVTNDGTNSYGMVLARSLKRGEKGWLVFIPEEG